MPLHNDLRFYSALGMIAVSTAGYVASLVADAPDFGAHKEPSAQSVANPWALDKAAGEGVRTEATDVYFSGCNEARAAGFAPMYYGEPGYRPEMDGDSDGIACEPYRGQ